MFNNSRGVVQATQQAAEALRVTQTGQLNWNMVGIVAALVLVLAVLAAGG